MNDQMDALLKARDALNVWLHMHAGDMCDEGDVDEARRKIREAGGTLGFINAAIDDLTEAIGDGRQKPKQVSLHSAAMKVLAIARLSSATDASRDGRHDQAG